MPEGRRVHGSGLLVKGLSGNQAGDGGLDHLMSDDAPLGHGGRMPLRLSEALDPAQPAAGRAGRVSPAAAIIPGDRFLEPHPQFQPILL
jgi:hypothetical protein